MKCSYCKQQGHTLYEDCDDETVNINCPKSEHYERNFESREDFQDWLDIRNVCQELWELDDRLTPGKDYEITPGGRNLFKRVNQSAFDHDLYDTFKDLLHFYHARDGVQEHYDSRKVNELYKFIDLLMETPVMKKVYDVLVEDEEIADDKKQFRRELWKLWFKLYGDDLDRCSFKHIFCGEIVVNHGRGHTVGLHNWIQYYLQQKAGNIEYDGWVGTEERDKTANMATISFSWMGYHKKKGSMFVGTTPVFEIALYTYLFFVGDESDPNELKFGDHDVDVTIHRGIPGQQPGLLTAFPEEVIDEDD